MATQDAYELLEGIISALARRDAALRSRLQPAPEGYRWQSLMQVVEPNGPYVPDVKVRIVYRLEPE